MNIKIRKCKHCYKYYHPGSGWLTIGELKQIYAVGNTMFWYILKIADIQKEICPQCHNKIINLTGQSPSLL